MQREAADWMAGRSERNSHHRSRGMGSTPMTRSSRPFWLGEDKRGWDHIRIHVAAVRDSRLGPYHFAVYSALIAHAEIDTGDARPSIATVAGYFEGSKEQGRPSGMSERTARLCIHDLVAWGYIEVEIDTGKASRYRVLPPPTAAGAAGVELDSAAGAAAPPRQELPGTAAGAADEQDKSPKQEKERREREQSFEAFWKSYPARNGRKLEKRKAREYFLKLSPTDLELVRKGVKSYALACIRGEQLAKDAHRWLRDRSFEEWAEIRIAGSRPDGPTAQGWKPEELCEHGMPQIARCEDCEAQERAS
jgi:hypothetical protein